MSAIGNVNIAQFSSKKTTCQKFKLKSNATRRHEASLYVTVLETSRSASCVTWPGLETDFHRSVGGH